MVRETVKSDAQRFFVPAPYMGPKRWVCASTTRLIGMKSSGSYRPGRAGSSATRLNYHLNFSLGSPIFWKDRVATDRTIRGDLSHTSVIPLFTTELRTNENQ
jgi:hypothetical protein